MYLTICVCVKVSKLMQYLFVKWPWVRMKSLLSVVLFCPSLVASFYSIPQCSNKSTEQSPTTFPADESIGLNNAFTPSFVNVSFSVCLRVCVWSKHTHPWKHVWLIEGWIEDEIRGKMRLNMNPSSQQDTQCSHGSDDTKPLPGRSVFLDTDLLLHRLSSAALCLRMITFGHYCPGLHMQRSLSVGHIVVEVAFGVKLFTWTSDAPQMNKPWMKSHE